MSYGYDMFDYDYVEPKDRVELLTEGQYRFRIHQALPKTSKSGNRMLEVMCKVTDNDGRDWHIYDYLIWTPDDPAGKKRFATKLGNIAKAVGKAEIDAPGYDKKKLPEDLVGAGGQCYVKIQEDKTGQFSDKNVISKWLPYEDKEATMRAQMEALDDKDIPF